MRLRIARAILRRIAMRREIFQLRRNLPGGARASVQFNRSTVNFVLPDYYSWSWMMKNRYANANHWHEPSATRLFEFLARDHCVLFDIGAHIGYFSVLFTTVDGNRALAVEPLADNFVRLQAVGQALPPGRLQVRRCAISDRRGVTRFASGGEVPSTAHIVTDSIAYASETVPMSTLSGLIEDTGLTPDLLKIDVEGAEGRVLSSASEVLERDEPTIILEVHRRQISNFGSLTYQGIVDMLRSVGYQLFVFQDHRSSRPTPLRPLQQIESKSNFDMIAMSKSRHEIIHKYNASIESHR